MSLFLFSLHSLRTPGSVLHGADPLARLGRMWKIVGIANGRLCAEETVRVNAENLLVHFLRSEFERRVARRPNYSMRAFARDLELAPSFLSDVLAGKKGISPDRSERLCQALRLDERQSHLLKLFVSANYSKSGATRASAAHALAALGRSGETLLLEQEHFQMISEWYHFAILEALELAGVAGHPSEIGEILRLPAEVVQGALARLELLGLVGRAPEGNFTPRISRTVSDFGVPNDAVRRFHKGMLEKILHAVDNCPIEDRELSTLVLSLNRDQVADFKEFVRSLAKDALARFGNSPSRDAVYSFSVQLLKIGEAGPRH